MFNVKLEFGAMEFWSIEMVEMVQLFHSPSLQ